MARITKDKEIKTILEESKVVAVVGMSQKTWRDSNKIGRYLMDNGYRVIPVNPAYDEIDGEKCYDSLKDVPADIDIVDVFRKPEAVAEIANEAIDVGAKTLWLQLGVVDEEAAEKAANAGLNVIMDHCVMVEHRKLL